MDQIRYPACAGPLVQNILVVDKFERPHAGFVFEATSSPGHLIHLVVTGKVRQEVSGYECDLRPGSAVWYYEEECVRGRVLEAPWVFYTVNFIAPGFPPPNLERRVAVAPTRTEEIFGKLLHAWRDMAQPRLVREFTVQARLLELLSEVWPAFEQTAQSSCSTNLWWPLEISIRRELTRPVSLADMRRISGVSSSTIIRACREAVGTTPMKRVKHVRLSMARGLVHRSAASLSEIGERVGYTRIHEFSRDYKKHFGLPPSADRKRG